MTCLARENVACAYQGVDDYALEQLGLRLKQAREAAQLSQGRAASKAEIDVGTLSKYELGKVREPALPKIHRLALLYGVRVEWLVSGAGPIGAVQTQTLEREDAIGYPAIEAYLDAHPDLTLAEQAELRGLRRSGGPDQVTYEVVEGYHRGMRARDKLRPRPKLTE